MLDLVPLREIAAYRSYVNVVQTLGRSAGGPIGGAFAQSIGWRWAFLIQAPLAILAMILVAWKLKVEPKKERDDDIVHPRSIGSKLKRIDVVGASFMSLTILAALLILDMGGDKIPWTSPVIGILAAVAVVSALLFFFAEKYWAREPIFPLRLLSHKDVVLDYLMMLVQIASQTAVSVHRLLPQGK